MSSLCLLQKVVYDDKHPLHSSLPDLAIFAHNTRQATAANTKLFSSIRLNTTQFSRSFILVTSDMWNIVLSLPSAVVESPDFQMFE